MVNRAVILKFINFINLLYFIKKLQHNGSIPQGSHYLKKNFNNSCASKQDRLNLYFKPDPNPIS